ncbi:hypothetical protein WA158_001663 [Blastocystis sp. Blastoise]
MIIYLCQIPTNADSRRLYHELSLYLNPQKTSHYDFYQYFLQLTDEDGEKFLPYYTDLPDKEIQEIIMEHRKTPENRLVQKTIAKSLITEIRGEEAYRIASACTDILFKRIYDNITIEEIEPYLNELPAFEIPYENIKDKKLLDILFQCKFGPSKKDIQRVIKSGGLSLNNQIVKDHLYTLKESDIIAHKWLYVKRGKRQVLIIRVI